MVQNNTLDFVLVLLKSMIQLKKTIFLITQNWGASFILCD